MIEQTIQNKIITYLQCQGAYVRKNIATNRAGTPDITACIRGKFIALEVKCPGEKATKLQEYNLRLIRDAGGIAETVHSLEEAKNAIACL